jgi:predicted RNA-binding protein YlqC (UPF0109 family)
VVQKKGRIMEKDQKFVEDVVKAIVDTPDKVSTERTIDEMGVLIKLTVDPSDMGKVIGKDGKTAKSIRTLLRVLGAKNNARVNLKIVEPEGSEFHSERKEETTEKAEESEEKKDSEDLDVPNDVLA